MTKDKQLQPRKGLAGLEKCPTGIRGLDEITDGGLPRGRPTLVCGGAGCGKTLLAMEFIVRGIREFDEPGVFMAFEETAEELAKNVASLGFDLDDLIRRKKLAIDYVRVERSEIEETGEYDLEGLFVRLGTHDRQQVGAKRVVLDTHRGALRRPAQRGDPAGRAAPALPLAQGQGRHRRHHRRAGREDAHPPRPGGVRQRLRDLPGPSRHQPDRHAAAADRQVPRLHARDERVPDDDRRARPERPADQLAGPELRASPPSGSPPASPRLDAMLGGKGYYRGSSILVSGTAGTGKTSLAAAFADSVCRRGERCLYFAFEESPAQIIRNMASIGFDLDQWVQQGPAAVPRRAPDALRPGAAPGDHPQAGERVPARRRRHGPDHQPHRPSATAGEVKAMLTRVIDFLKNQGITALFTSLTAGGERARAERGGHLLADGHLAAAAE